MLTKNPYAKYQDNRVFTASKEELTLMLYEGAVKFCNQAVAAIDAKNITEAHRLIVRIEEIVEEFQSTLNYKYPIAREFNTLYEYMYRRLVEANALKDKEIIKEVADLFREFADAWKQAMKIAKTTK